MRGRFQHLSVFAILSLAALAAPAHGQTTWYVDDDAPGPGSGTPADPYPTIQAAIGAPSTLDGDEISVAAGHYAPIDFLGKRLAIRGGADRIISGQGAPGPCVSARSGEPAGTLLEGFVLELGSAAPVQGAPRGGGVLAVGSHLEVRDCRIERCTAGSAASPGYGGGVAALGRARVTLVGTTITASDARFGGGMSVEGSDAVLEDCTLDGNGAGGFALDGGGLYFRAGRVAVRRSTFHGNQAMRGAGASVAAGRAEFESCTFDSNTNAFGCVRGGAIDGQGRVTGTLFHANRAQFGGALHGAFEVHACTFVANGFDQPDSSFGGAFHSGGAAGAAAAGSVFIGNFAFGQGGATHGVDLSDCVLSGNLANEDGQGLEDGLGGAMYRGSATRCWLSDNRTTDSGNPFLDDAGGAAHSASLTLCVLTGNESTAGGAAAECELERCTVVGNAALAAGGALRGGATVVSSILRGNAPDEIAPGAAGLPSVAYSNVEGGAPGPGNLDADPLFWGPAARNFRLMAGSPCIDSGDPLAFDPDGSRADMGAFPFDPAYVGAPGNYCTAKTSSAGCLPRIGALGPPSLGGADFVVRAERVIGGTFGVLFWSRQPSAHPYANGTLCIAAPLARVGPIAGTGTGGCDGTLEWRFTAGDLSQAALAPGERMHLQWFFRDPLQTDGTGLGMTDGLEATVLP